MKIPTTQSQQELSEFIADHKKNLPKQKISTKKLEIENIVKRISNL